MIDKSGIVSFTVFPFLKTDGPVSVGNLTFRSTDDPTGLSGDDAARLQEISAMLFLQDDLHIRSASYAAVPLLDLDAPASGLQDLVRVQLLVAYLYSKPNAVSGEPFLASEYASLLVLTPDKIPIYAVRPTHHVLPPQPSSPLNFDPSGLVQGYHGLYNFKHHFWVTTGSRIYPPVPHLALNITQDLKTDLECVAQREFEIEAALLIRPGSTVSRRVLTAIGWSNRANALGSDDADEEIALMHLAVAFEALLELPRGKGVTRRFKEAVGLLLGPIPRLDEWLEQFYQARSDIVHTGRAERLRFVTGKHQIYHPLLGYGRQVFRLCVRAILTGAALAADAGLEEKLVTNQERFELICKALDDKSVGSDQRLRNAADYIAAANKYSFVGESGLNLETMLGAARRAAQCLLDCAPSVDSELQARLQAFAAAKKSDDHYDELEALMLLHTPSMRSRRGVEESESVMAVLRLVDAVCGMIPVVMRYVTLKEQRRDGGDTPSNQRQPVIMGG